MEPLVVKFRTGEVWSWQSLAFWVNFFHARRVLVSRWDAKDRDKTLIFEEKPWLLVVLCQPMKPEFYFLAAHVESGLMA